MNKKLLCKAIISCIIGIIIWGIFHFIVCMIDNKPFVETFFTVGNIVPIVCIMIIGGIAYYISENKKAK